MSLGEILLIPGVTDPLTQLKSLLFKQGQAGGIWVPSLSPSMISSESFGTGVQTFLDLSGNGKNATQASSGSRPAWGRVPKSGKRNLLTYSEQLDNANWVKLNTTVDPNTSETLDPIGGSTADKLTVSNIIRRLYQSFLSVTAGDTFTYSFFTKAGTCTEVQYRVMNTAETTNSAGNFVFETETFTGALGPYVTERTFTNEGNGWYRIIVKCTVPVGETTIRFNFGLPESGTTAYGWGAQVETGSTATTYQKVTTAFDITESGQRDCYYLQPDGVDDGMATASIDFSGTDKVTVFAAVRKLSDAAIGSIIENPTVASDGTFALLAPSSLAANAAFASKGTAQATATATGLTAPVTFIATGLGDISGDSAIIRINGVQSAQSTADQGSGNYRNDVMQFFRRGGSSLPFGGQCFGLIVAGGSYPISTIQRVESILSRYTPEVSL